MHSRAPLVRANQMYGSAGSCSVAVVAGSSMRLAVPLWHSLVHPLHYNWFSLARHFQPTVSWNAERNSHSLMTVHAYAPTLFGHGEKPEASGQPTARVYVHPKAGSQEEPSGCAVHGTARRLSTAIATGWQRNRSSPYVIRAGHGRDHGRHDQAHRTQPVQAAPPKARQMAAATARRRPLIRRLRFSTFRQATGAAVARAGAAQGWGAPRL